MTKKEFYSFLSVLTILIILSGCVATLQSYQPKNPAEVKIKELLLRWESTWNSHDVQGHLALWNDKAQIMYGGDRQIASKKEYTDILPERMRVVPSLNVGTLDIKISGDKAQVSTVLTGGRYPTPIVFNLIRENDTWSIMSFKY